MLSVEDLLRETLHTLRDQGELGNTYVVFTSDNGFHLGEHAIDKGKQTAYEEDIGVPLYVRGPGVPAGETRNQLALNTDLAPTFTDLAGVRSPGEVDGRSLAPLLDETPLGDWRSAFLIENYHDEDEFASYIPGYRAVRTENRLYVEYETGEKELYDLSEDPYELQNLAGERPEAQAALQERMEALEGCSASSCRRAEDGVSVPAAPTGR